MAEREGGETATYIYKKKKTHTQKKRYSKTIKGKSLDDGEERGLPSHYKKKKEQRASCCQVLARVLLLV